MFFSSLFDLPSSLIHASWPETTDCRRRASSLLFFVFLTFSAAFARDSSERKWFSTWASDLEWNFVIKSSRMTGLNSIIVDEQSLARAEKRVGGSFFLCAQKSSSSLGEKLRHLRWSLGSNLLRKQNKNTQQKLSNAAREEKIYLKRLNSREQIRNW